MYIKQASKQATLKISPALARLASPNVEAAHPSRARAARSGIARRRSLACALATALDRFLAASQKHGMKAYLLYLPCKRRVMHGHLRQGTDYPQPDWQPGDLPQHLSSECQKRGIAFIDATPSLSSAAAAGQNTFNPIYATHFNAEGHRLVGEVLAEALK